MPCSQRFIILRILCPWILYKHHLFVSERHSIYRLVWTKEVLMSSRQNSIRSIEAMTTKTYSYICLTRKIKENYNSISMPQAPFYFSFQLFSNLPFETWNMIRETSPKILSGERVVYFPPLGLRVHWESYKFELCFCLFFSKTEKHFLFERLEQHNVCS